MLSAQQVYGGGKEGVTVSYRINIGDMECGESRGGEGGWQHPCENREENDRNRLVFGLTINKSL